MQMLRKTDLYGQWILCGLAALSIPFTLWLGPLICLFILGSWQLISGIVNTYIFLHAGKKREIIQYWIYSLSALSILVFCLLIKTKTDNDDIDVLFWIAIAASFGIAIFYWKIYHDLIEHLKLRSELNGLLKSKS